MTDVIATLAAIVTADVTGLTRGLDKAKRGLQDTAKEGVNLGKLAAAGVAVVGAAAVAAGAAAVGMAIEFDKSMTNIQSVTKGTSDQMAKMRGEILTLGAQSLAGPQALAAAMYDVVGGVADASTHMAILKAASATAEAGNASLAATTKGLISVMNAYKFSAQQAGFASDVLTQTVGKGVGTMDEMVAAISPIAGLAANVHISFNELGAAMAYMTTQGTSAAQSATQLKAVMTSLLNPSVQMSAALKRLGYESGSAAIEHLGLVGTINALQQAAGGSTDKMAKMLGSVEALQGAVALAGPGMKQFGADFESSLNGATAAAQKIQLQSVTAQFELFKNTLSSAAIAIGSVILPALNGLFSGINQLIQVAVKLAPLFAEDIGPAFSGLGGDISAALGPIMGALAKIGGAIKDFFATILADDTGLSAAQMRLSKKLGEVITPDATLKERATAAFKQLGDDISAALAGVDWDSVLGKVAEVGLKIGIKLVEGLVGLGQKLQGKLVEAIKSVDWGSVIGDILAKATAASQQIVSAVVAGIKGLGEQLIAAIGAELDKVIGGIKDKANQIGAAIAGAITGTGAGAPIPKEPGSTTANPNYDPTKPVLNADGTTAQAPKNKGMDAVLATGKQQRQVAAGGGGATGSTSGGENDAYAYIEGFEGIMEQNGYRLGAAIQSALDSVQVNVTGLSAKLAAMFSGADITAAVTNLGTVVSGALTSTFGADGAVMTALQPFEDSWAQIFGAGGSVAAAATGMQGVIDMLVGSIVSISGTGTPAILEFQAVSTSAAPTIAGAWQPVVGVFRQLLMTLEGIAGAAQRATGAMGAIPGVGGGGGGRGYAEGGYTGSGSSSAVAGVVHKNEYVVPQGGALVMRGGDSGGAISIQNVNVYGVTNPAQMYDQIRKEANRRNA